jgi:hypothetical protein
VSPVLGGADVTFSCLAEAPSDVTTEIGRTAGGRAEVLITDLTMSVKRDIICHA